MAHPWFGWSETQIEAIVTQFLEEGKFPPDIEREVSEHLDRGEPLQALDVGMRACNETLTKRRDESPRL